MTDIGSNAITSENGDLYVDTDQLLDSIQTGASGIDAIPPKQDLLKDNIDSESKQDAISEEPQHGEESEEEGAQQDTEAHKEEEKKKDDTVEHSQNGKKKSGYSRFKNDLNLERSKVAQLTAEKQETEVAVINSKIQDLKEECDYRVKLYNDTLAELGPTPIRDKFESEEEFIDAKIAYNTKSFEITRIYDEHNRYKEKLDNLEVQKNKLSIGKIDNRQDALLMSLVPDFRKTMEKAADDYKAGEYHIPQIAKSIMSDFGDLTTKQMLYYYAKNPDVRKELVLLDSKELKERVTNLAKDLISGTISIANNSQQKSTPSTSQQESATQIIKKLVGAPPMKPLGGNSGTQANNPYSDDLYVDTTAIYRDMLKSR